MWSSGFGLSCASLRSAAVEEISQKRKSPVPGSAAVSDVGGLYVGERWSGAKIGVRQAIVPGQGIFIPQGPQKTHKKSASRKHVTHTAPQHLARRRSFAGKAGDVQAAKHHAGSCAAENRE